MHLFNLSGQDYKSNWKVSKANDYQFVYHKHCDLLHNILGLLKVPWWRIWCKSVGKQCIPSKQRRQQRCKLDLICLCTWSVISFNWPVLLYNTKEFKVWLCHFSRLIPNTFDFIMLVCRYHINTEWLFGLWFWDSFVVGCSSKAL